MRLPALVLLLAAFTACGSDTDKDASDTPSDSDAPTDTEDGPVDADGDGVSADQDCDDSDASKYPGADEACDDLDNDCDSAIDEGVKRTVYTDADRDGYGDPASASEACEAGDGTSLDNTDCDDDASGVNPDAVEVCDGLDNDCDEHIDDADTGLDLSTAETWYGDADGDGFGDPDLTTTACEAPSGYGADAGDCDDADAATHPDATEVCDERDNDCDSLVDDADDSLDASTGETFYADSDGDGYGDADATTQACTLPSGYVTDDQDCDDSDADANPDGTEVPQDGIDQDCDGDDPPYTVSDLIEGDLVITEVMNNPYAVSDGSGEWFEIYNNAGGTIDLDGLYVYDADSDGFSVSGTLELSDGDYLVMGLEDDTGLNGGVEVDYVYGASDMALANGDDEIYLSESASMVTLIDGIEWDDGETFPDPIGSSMMLDVDATDAEDNDDGENWCKSTSELDGGDRATPGYENDECPSYTLIGEATAGSTYNVMYADYILGQKITVSSDTTLDAFGAWFIAAGADFKIALYTDASGPDTLVAFTSSATGSEVGEVVVDVPDTSLPAGDYWLMAWFDGTAYVSSDSASTTYRYYGKSFGSFPTSLSGTSSSTTNTLSYYIQTY